MARISRKIALTEEELDALMASSWNMRIATVGGRGRINLTPMWFGWVNGKIYFTGRGQKIVNLRENPTASVLVDGNERFPELVGAMFQGTAQVLEDAAAEEADPDLEEARMALGTKYAGGHGEADAPSSDAPPGAGSSSDAPPGAGSSSDALPGAGPSSDAPPGAGPSSDAPPGAGPQRRDTTASGETNRWVVFTPDRLVSWDNAKIAALQAARG